MCITYSCCTFFYNRKEANVLDLRKRYPNLYVPSDMFLTRPLWSDTFPAHRSFQFPRPVSFHIMNKEVEPVLENSCVYDSADINHTFAAKVNRFAFQIIKGGLSSIFKISNFNLSCTERICNLKS